MFFDIEFILQFLQICLCNFLVIALILFFLDGTFLWFILNLVLIEFSTQCLRPFRGTKRTFFTTVIKMMDTAIFFSAVSHKNVYENLIKLQSNDEVKFVISDRQDYEFMKKVLKKYPTQAQILVSPMFGIDMKPVIGKILVDWVIEDNINCRFNFQVHKFMGVE